MVMDAVILRENASEIMNILGEVIAEIALRPDRLVPALAAARAEEGAANLALLDGFVAQTPGLELGPPAGRADRARAPARRGSIRTSSPAACWRRRGAPSCCPAAPMASWPISASAWAAAPSVRLEEGLDRLAGLLASWDKGTAPHRRPRMTDTQLSVAGEIRAEVRLPTQELRDDIPFFTQTLGMRLEMIFPADDPRVAVFSGHGLRIRVEKDAPEPPGTLRLMAANPDAIAGGARTADRPQRHA
jgi:hypothetical protein